MNSIVQPIEQSISETSEAPALYIVKPGDTLSQIIAKYYDIHYQDPRYHKVQATLIHFNDTLTDPHVIHPGQLLWLVPLTKDDATAMCPVPVNANKPSAKPFDPTMIADSGLRQWLMPSGQTTYSEYAARMKRLMPSTSKEQEAFWALAWLDENYGVTSVAATAGFNAFGGLVSQAHNAFVVEVKHLVLQYYRGELTTNEYSYRRRKALEIYQRKIGPFERLLFKGKTAREAIRIDRTKALPATGKIDAHLERLGSMAKFASRGGLVLTAAGVGMGCYQIANANTQHKKNEIFVETVGSTVVGTGTGIALTLLFASNPVGWGVALVLGSAAAISSYAAGKGLVSWYNRDGEKIDFVGISGVNQLCKR